MDSGSKYTPYYADVYLKFEGISLRTLNIVSTCFKGALTTNKNKQKTSGDTISIRGVTSIPYISLYTYGYSALVLSRSVLVVLVIAGVITSDVSCTPCVIVMWHQI